MINTITQEEIFQIILKKFKTEIIFVLYCFDSTLLIEKKEIRGILTAVSKFELETSEFEQLASSV